MKKVAILISRQNRRFTSQTPWVKNTCQAMEWMHTHQYSLMTSIGTPPFSLILTILSKFQLAAEIILPLQQQEELEKVKRRVLHDFKLSESTITFTALQCNKTMNKSEIMQYRDRYITEQSDLILPVSIRKNGFLHSLIECISSASSPGICNRFRIQNRQKPVPHKYHIDKENIDTTINHVTKNFIIHWTRTAYTPGENDNPCDFYSAILDDMHYPHGAFSILRKILRCKKILATRRHMPGKIKTVSFSSVPPTDMGALMQWRKRYGEMSFEPYGIGISESFAEKTGIKPVLYRTVNEIKAEPEDLWRTQSPGLITNWKREQEYRHKGHYSLSSIPPDKMIAVTRFDWEASLVREEFGIPAFNFEKSPDFYR